MHIYKKRRLLFSAVSAAAIIGGASAHAQLNRTHLPIAETVFTGEIKEYVQDSTGTAPMRVTAPAGAPNVFVFMSDDVGFAMSSTFGGPVATPNFDRLANRGSRYNRFHTTGICSPSRAALLTGRNHHNAAYGYLGQANYPGYTGRIPASTATVAETLRLNGYSTAMFGKHHNAGGAEAAEGSSFDYWPTGLGFEYFYGWIGGYADQFNPSLFRGTNRVPATENKGDVVDKRLADDAIHWIRSQKAVSPDKPFFIYYAPGSAHAPLQAPAEWIDRYKGQFNQGWDKLREESYRRQLRDGVIPKGTKLTPRPDDIPAWDSLNDEQRRFFSRTMEVAAGMLAYQDDQLGRVFAELDRMGQFDDTLIMFVQGDNGGAAESGNAGAVNELYRTFGGPIPEELTPELLAKLGGEETRPAYPAGWAWATNSPFPGTKQYASMLGGIRNAMIMTWPARQKQAKGEFCPQFGHLVDIAPTVLEAAGIPAPESVRGVKQKPLDGQSLLSSLNQCERDKPRTQYFEIAGKGGLYHDGWFASREDGRSAWLQRPPGEGKPTIRWSLYDLRSDFSQSTDVSSKHPEQMKNLIQLWESEAKRNNVYPLIHAFGYARYPADLIQQAMKATPKPVTLWGKDVSVSTNSIPAHKSFTLTADISRSSADASGVIVSAGGWFSGWSLYLDQGRPALAYVTSPEAVGKTIIAADHALPAGKGQVRLDFKVDGLGGPATIRLLDGQGKELATGTVAQTFPTYTFGDSLDVGHDAGVPVIHYPSHVGTFDGDIQKVQVNFAP